MSGSLKDQLMKAGFKPSEDVPSSKPRRQRTQKKKTKKSPVVEAGAVKKIDHHRQLDEQAELRKQQKAKIKVLIESHAEKDIAGEVVYRFTLQNRIRELHISESIRQQILSKDAVITRLNGSTYIIPATIGEQILSINPAWAMVKVDDSDSSDTTDGYDDYPVPDDLIW